MKRQKVQPDRKCDSGWYGVGYDGDRRDLRLIFWFTFEEFFVSIKIVNYSAL